MMKNFAFFDQNGWTIAHENDEKCAFIEQNAWFIAQQMMKNARFLTKRHGQ